MLAYRGQFRVLSYRGAVSVRIAHGSVWLTNLTGAKVWRLPVPRR